MNYLIPLTKLAQQTEQHARDLEWEGDERDDMFYARAARYRERMENGEEYEVMF